MSRPQPSRTSRWQRLVDILVRSAARPAPDAQRSWVDDPQSRPRPDLLQSLGGRTD